MDRVSTWALRLGLVGALAGALLSRDACLGGSHPPPPSPNPPQSTAPPTAAPQADPAPAPTGTYATPP